MPAAGKSLLYSLQELGSESHESRGCYARETLHFQAMILPAMPSPIPDKVMSSGMRETFARKPEMSCNRPISCTHTQGLHLAVQKGDPCIGSYPHVARTALDDPIESI